MKITSDGPHNPSGIVTKERYNNIDGLRAFAAVGIALMHYLANMSPAPDMGILSSVLIPKATDGVFLFFMVSGFALSCGYHGRIKDGSLDINSFYTKRYKRILPFFLLLCAAELAAGFSISSLKQVFLNGTLAFGLLPNPSMDVVGVGWFLGVVFLFYMLFPFFVFLTYSKRRAVAVLLLSVAVSWLCQDYFFTPAFVDRSPGRANILYSAPFLIGGIVAYLYRHSVVGWVSRHQRLMLAMCVAGSVLLWYCTGRIPEMADMVLMIAVFGGWLLFALGPDRPVLHNRVVGFVSDLSLEFYLCHMMMFRILERLPLQDYLGNGPLCYAVICVLGINMALLFAYSVRRFFFLLARRVPALSGI